MNEKRRDELKSQVDMYCTFDNAFPYTGADGTKKPLLLHPVKMTDVLFFNYGVEALTVDKNNMPDLDIIQMPYLTFLLSQSNNENLYAQKLLALFSVVTRLGDKLEVLATPDNKKISIAKDGEVYTHREFDEIRYIICEQNKIDLPDEKMSSKLRDVLEQSRKHRQKFAKGKVASLEGQMVALSIGTGMSMQDIYEMTYRKFMEAVERFDRLLHYKIYVSASMSGFVKFEDKDVLTHWLIDKPKDPFGDMIPLEDFEKKVSGK